MAIKNPTGITLALAVWLVNDDYDYSKDPNYISVTTLMKPVKQIILGKRVDAVRERELGDFIAAQMGTALHDSIEKAWVNNHKRNLAKLGYPQSVIDRVLVNPTPEQLAAVKDPIPVYIEQRAFKQVGKWKIGGKFDMVAEGIVHDNKSTSAYTWLYGGRDNDYRLQGSQYRWLNPDKITEDFIRINYIFTDWSSMSAKQNPDYPQQRVAHKEVSLLSVADTEKWVTGKLNQIETLWDADESRMPECTDEELWRSAPVHKYYSNPAKTEGRSTKNFESMGDARAFMAEKGGVGVIKVVEGEPKRCSYCDAFDICKQKDKYKND